MFNNLIPKLYKVANKLKKKAPEIWLGAGIILFVTDTVLAVKAGTKLKETVQPKYEEISHYKEEAFKFDATTEAEELKYYKERINATQRDLFKDLAGLLAPVVLVNGAGCFCFFKCYKTLKDWNMGLVVAYNAVLDAYTAYRTNNVALNGDKTDQLALIGGKNHQINDPETNEMIDAIICPNRSVADLYGRIFSEETSSIFNPSWKKNPQYILNALRIIEATAEDKRQRTGKCALADALIALGMATEAYTFVHGWDKTPVSFGLDKYSEETIHQFMKGVFASIRLEFNCDGLIIDAINKNAEVNS